MYTLSPSLPTGVCSKVVFQETGPWCRKGWWGLWFRPWQDFGLLGQTHSSKLNSMHFSLCESLPRHVNKHELYFVRCLLKSFGGTYTDFTVKSIRSKMGVRMERGWGWDEANRQPVKCEVYTVVLCRIFVVGTLLSTVEFTHLFCKLEMLHKYWRETLELLPLSSRCLACSLLSVSCSQPLAPCPPLEPSFTPPGCPSPGPRSPQPPHT